MKTTLICVVLLLLTTYFASSTALECDDKYINMTMACEGESCHCSCETIGFPPTHEVVCPPDYTGITIEFIPLQYASIECTTNDEYVIPNMRIGDVDKVGIKGCSLPVNSSFGSMIDKLGIQNFQSFYLTTDPKESNVVQKEHFRGLSGVTRISITAAELIELSENVFDELQHITWLQLKNIKSLNIRDAISKLVNLRNLEITGTALKRLEDGMFENLTSLQSLSLWSNKLESISKENFRGLSSLVVLDLLNNRIDNLDNNTFEYLTNLAEVNLNKNLFKSLPEGLFRLNQNLREVKLVYNNIPSLPSALFANIPGLIHVYMSSSGIQTIPDNLFANSNNIVNIILSDNRIQIVPGTVFRGLVNLQKLELQNNAISNLDNDLLIDCKQLSHLDLSHNQIESIPRDFFQSADNLESLYFGNNRLTKIDNYVFNSQTKLKVIDMSNNYLNFDSMYKFYDDGLSNSPFQNQINLESLNLRNNSLSSINRDFTFALVNLKNLDLSYNNISYVSQSNLQFAGRNMEVDLTYNNISTVDFIDFEMFADAQEDGFYRSIRIKLNHNPLKCDCGLFYFAKFMQNKYIYRSENYYRIESNNLTCAGPERLQRRLFKDVDLMDLTCEFTHYGTTNQTCPEKCSCEMRLEDRALIVNCAEAQLTEVPELPEVSKLKLAYTILHIENNRIEELPSIEDSLGYSEVQQIFARGNNISYISVENLPNNLTTLDISGNNLQALDENVLTKLNAKSLKLSLSSNWWPCDCEMKNLFIYMQSNYERISDYSDINCPDGNELAKMSVGEVCSEELQNYIILCVTLALLGIIIGLLVAIYYKYQQEIKIWMYWNNVLPFIFNSDVLDNDRKYDAFISYSHKDEDFVVDELMPELENKRKFNLCIHRRDWTPGDFIPEQIIRSVSESRRTIIVLSPHYLESVWGTMEFRAAHKSAMEDQVARVIVLVYGKVDKATLNPELKSYIDMNTYIEWGDPWFWERLHYALRTINTKKKQSSKQNLKTALDDKLELIHPSPITSPMTTPPAEGIAKHPLNGVYNCNGINGQMNGGFIINQISKQSDL